MIVGQILINGVSFSCHRFPESRGSLHRVRQALAEMVQAEQLERLGQVEIRVQNQRGLDRLMAALLGLNEV